MEVNMIIKKGTKVKIWACSHDLQSERDYDLVLDEDMTESELDDTAKEFMWESLQPEWGFKILQEQK